jgi:hypothetical protein
MDTQNAPCPSSARIPAPEAAGTLACFARGPLRRPVVALALLAALASQAPNAMCSMPAMTAMLTFNSFWEFYDSCAS